MRYDDLEIGRALARSHRRQRCPGPPDFSRHGSGSGGGKTTVTNQVPGKTPEEIALIGKQNEILDIQISELKRQNGLLTEMFPQQKALFEAQTSAAISNAEFTRIQTQAFTELLPGQIQFQKDQQAALSELLPGQVAFQKEQMEASRRSTQLQEQLVTKALAEMEGTPEEQEIRKLSNARALSILKGEAPPLLPGQQERIDKVFGRASEEAQAGLRTFGDEMAASRGMNITDSPIGGEMLRQGKELALSLSAAKAGAELSVGQTEMQFGEAVRQFQENIRQRGFENRLALTGNMGGGGMGGGARLPVGAGGGSVMTPQFAGTTTSGAMAGAQGLLGQLSADRLGQATQTSRAADPGFNYTRAAIGGTSGALAGAGTGAALGTAAGPYGTAIGAGVGALAGFFGGGYAGSSARLKKGILPYDPDEYDKALDKIRATPITTYKYKWEPESKRRHTGPILELAPEEIREDALRINLLDYSGLIHAGVKALDRKVARLEARLPVAV